jgi:hypothetical protein
MTAMANILVKDDAATPVEFTFKPVTDTPTPFWRTAIAGVPFEGQARAWFIEDKLKDGNFKRTIKLEIPVMETLGASGTAAGYVAPPKVAYTESWFLTNISNRRATQADRANGVKILNGIMCGASSTTATGTLDNTSAGDAWKAAATTAAIGPAFLIDALIPN